LRRSNFIVILI